MILYLKKVKNYKHTVEDFEAYANYLNRQLEVLDYYMYVDKAVNAMNVLKDVFITEKRKVLVLRLLKVISSFESIAMLEHNVNTLIQNAKDAGIPENMRNELLYKYYSVNAITDKGEVIDNWLLKANDYLLENKGL